jgi:quercetin dioxygenase-like cupin family protein
MMRHACISHEEAPVLQRFAVTFVALAFAGATAAQQPAPAASPGIKRTILQKVEVPGTNYETILGMAEIAPGMNAGRHTHPGPETGTVTEGEMVLMIDGQPDKTLRAGDSYQIPAGTVHDVRTVGGPAKVVAVYMVPKGMALAMPAK